MSDDDDISRWQKRAPISGMRIEEMKARVADGVKRRRDLGQLPRKATKIINTVAAGPVLTKPLRKVLIRAAELAIYALASAQREDYCHAAEIIDIVRREAGMTPSFMKEVLEGVATQAAIVSGEPFNVLDQLARFWLSEFYKPSEKIISINRGKTDERKKH